MVVGAPMRALARRLSSSLPQATYEELQLVVGDAELTQDAETFFARTRDALGYAAAHAPAGYARLREDVRTIVLRREEEDPPYNRFQLAVLVPAEIALEADAQEYAVWLLYISGLSRNTREAADRSSPIERTLDAAQREHVQRWLPGSNVAPEDRKEDSAGGL